MAMARHVVAVLDAAPSIGAIWVVAPNDPALAPAGWIADGACGLNAEIAAARAVLGDGPALLIHADLPLLSVEDVEALVAAADDAGAAIAPDIAQTGTNAIALADGRAFAPAFGVDSFARHRAVLGDAAIVRREGLSRDIDEPNTIHFVPPHSLDSDPRSANGGGKDRQGG
jgi:2-phospho-L-lactate guanylyltransferase